MFAIWPSGAGCRGVEVHVRTNHNRAMVEPQPTVVRRNRASRACSPGSLGHAEPHTAEDGAREGSVGAKVWQGTGANPSADDASGDAGGGVLVSAAVTDLGLASDPADGLKGGHRRGERIQQAVTVKAVIALRSAATTVGAGRFRGCRRRSNARTHLQMRLLSEFAELLRLEAQENSGLAVWTMVASGS